MSEFNTPVFRSLLNSFMYSGTFSSSLLGTCLKAGLLGQCPHVCIAVNNTMRLFDVFSSLGHYLGM